MNDQGRKNDERIMRWITIGAITAVCALCLLAYLWFLWVSGIFHPGPEDQKTRYVQEILHVHEEDPTVTYTILTRDLETLKVEDIGSDGTLDRVLYPVRGKTVWPEHKEGEHLDRKWSDYAHKRIFDDTLELLKQQEVN